MIRIWFNHWFSTAYGIIELMKKDTNEEIYIIGSNQRMNSVIQNVCDEWYEEPEGCGDEYACKCLEFCHEHNINVFVPHRNMMDISRHKQSFEASGIYVMVEDYETMKLLGNKVETYRTLGICEGLYIPDYAIADLYEELKGQYGKMHEVYSDICIKLANDEGGRSYRRIRNNDEIPDIFNGEVKEAIIMPYLPDDEISVDCLNTSDGLIAIPRVKCSYRDEKVEYNEQIIDMCRKIYEKVNLSTPCNIQFKLCNGIPYLLEINTRMSGGLQMSCLASEVNIPNVALNNLLGRKAGWHINKQEHIVSYIEIPEIIA